MRSSEEASAEVRRITIQEAKKLNLTQENILPLRCEFCGRTLQATGLYVNTGFFKRWMHGPDDFEKCNCDGAAKHRIELKKKAEEEEKRRNEKMYQARIERLMHESKLGKRFMNRTFDSFTINSNNKDAYAVAKKYADDFEKYRENGDGLIFVGSYGTGKTHLAAAICHDIIKKGFQPIFGTLITLLGNIKATYDSNACEENEDKIINKYTSCDLLVIDDLGKEKPTEWVLEKLYYIVNARYESCLPIIITTNYDTEKLISRLTYKDNIETAQSIVSRIYEMCIGIDMIWEDYRRIGG